MLASEMKDPSLDPQWMLYSPGSPDPDPPPPLPLWIQDICTGAKVSFGEVEDCPAIPEVVEEGWTCAVIPEYLVSWTVVASLRAPDGRYAMLFLHKKGPDIERSNRQAEPDLIGWFYAPLLEPVTDRQSLVKNLLNAISLIVSSGYLPKTVIRRRAPEEARAGVDLLVEGHETPPIC
jgi:hypothetical protein